MQNQCNKCSKQYTCNKEKCKPVWWHKTKGYGIPERKEKDDYIR